MSHCFLCNVAQYPTAVSNFLPPSRSPSLKKVGNLETLLVMISLFGELRQVLSFQSTDVMTVQNTFPTRKRHCQITFLDSVSYCIPLHLRLQNALILPECLLTHILCREKGFNKLTNVLELPKKHTNTVKRLNL